MWHRTAKDDLGGFFPCKAADLRQNADIETALDPVLGRQHGAFVPHPQVHVVSDQFLESDLL